MFCFGLVGPDSAGDMTYIFFNASRPTSCKLRIVVCGPVVLLVDQLLLFFLIGTICRRNLESRRKHRRVSSLRDFGEAIL